MPRTPLPRSATAALALALSPVTALAEPIGWGYQTSVTYAQDYGSRFAVLLNAGGPTTTPVGDTSWVPLFTSTGNPRPPAGEYLAQYEFTLGVKLTDQASGQSADLSFAGGYASHWTYQPGDDPDLWRWDYEASDFGDFWDRRTLTLGRNEYTVRAYGGGSGTFPFGELEVSVTPSAAPEPGTFALAGVGLTGLGAWRVRRRTAGPRPTA